MAVVKAEVDFIRNSFRAAGKQPEIIVHEHLRRIWRDRRGGRIAAALAERPADHVRRPGCRAKIKYRTTRNEETRCHFCKNDCLRTFIDIRTDARMT